MTVLSEAQIGIWREREAKRRNDAADIAFNRSRDKRRHVVRQQMLTFLDEFLSNRISLREFKETFDRKTRREWDTFGLKGTSGAMFLNTLVKHLPDQQAITVQLQRVLPLPQDAAEGRTRLQSFYDYLMGLIQRGTITRRQVQPMRATFFVSSWWHLQSTELWPPHYISAQRALSADNLYADSGDPIADYFAFRELFLALMDGLALPAWEVEHLLSWYDQRPPGTGPGPIPPEPPVQNGGSDEPEVDDEPPTVSESSTHTRVQWQLAKLGAALDCQVWIARNDHSRSHEGEQLGSLSVSSLPNLGMDDETRQIISLIDVIWLRGRQVVAAFEIESTTSIFSGILRMSDLLAVSPNISFPLYLVVPEERVPAVRRQLCRETFKALELPDRCRYFTFEALNRNLEGIMQWATGPEAVRKLAHRVECGK